MGKRLKTFRLALLYVVHAPYQSFATLPYRDTLSLTIHMSRIGIAVKNTLDKPAKIRSPAGSQKPRGDSISHASA
jgi:hypothetical protein